MLNKSVHFFKILTYVLFALSIGYIFLGHQAWFPPTLVPFFEFTLPAAILSFGILGILLMIDGAKEFPKQKTSIFWGAVFLIIASYLMINIFAFALHF